MTGTVREHAEGGARAAWTATGGQPMAVMNESAAASGAPAWADRAARGSQSHLTHGATTAAHSLRSGDHGGAGANPSLRQED
jgi:type IV secretion system protein TrbL